MNSCDSSFYSLSYSESEEIYYSLSWSSEIEDAARENPHIENIVHKNSCDKSTSIFNEKWAKTDKTAVVIPCFLNKKENEYYYLMAEDVPKIGKAVNDGDWSGFGGYQEDNDDKSLIDTAIRESTEESLNILTKLEKPLKMNKGVEFKNKNKSIYVIDLFPQYSLEEVNAFHETFNNALNQKELKEHQKEKKQLGWIKASEVAEKVLSSKAYTVYEKPCSNSRKLGENIQLRKCQQYFFEDVIDSLPNGLEAIENGLSGLEGQTIVVKKYQNQKNSQSYIRPSKLRPSDEKLNWKSTNNTKSNPLNEKPWRPSGTIQAQNNSIRKDFSRADESLSWRSNSIQNNAEKNHWNKLRDRVTLQFSKK